MNCPYCARKINAFTGLQELHKFERHLHRCRKFPGNQPLSYGRRTVLTPARTLTLRDALRIRAESRQ